MHRNESRVCAARHPQSSLTGELATMWLEREKPDETQDIEEQKKQQKEREKALAELDKRQREQRQESPPGKAH